jgi:septal ring factor EnvC (AmiA/AmiB activator)
LSTPRRQIVRTVAPATSAAANQHRQLQKLRGRLDHERQALARWQARLRRAFTATEKHQRQIARLERQITKWEDEHGSE